MPKPITVAPPASKPLWNGERYEHERIRIGYLSADYRLHPVAKLMAGVFEMHDRSRFETFALSITPPHRSAFRTRLEVSFEHFVEFETASDHDVARYIHEHEIDIVVDLMGYTRESRTGILALMPAPVQVNFLGYPGTMAAPYIDYILADRHVIPERDKAHYSEKIVYLPDSYMPHDSKRALASAPPSRQEAGLPETGFVFCSFNAAHKFSPQMFDIWMRLLAGIEGSVLWLAEPGAVAGRNLKSEATKRGVDPERIIFAPYIADDSDYLGRMLTADLFLDTSTFGTHSGASDALWAGLPLLTFAGGTFASRVAASLLNAASVPELIADSPEEYEVEALELARDEATLQALRDRLARAKSDAALFDTERFCRNIESAFEAMHDRAIRDEKPADIEIG